MDTTSQATLKQALLRRDKQKREVISTETEASTPVGVKTRDFLVVNFDAALAALLGIILVLLYLI